MGLEPRGWIWGLGLVLAALGVPGCNAARDDPVYFFSYGNLAPDAPAADVYEDGNLVLAGLLPGDISGYIERPWRPRQITFREAGADRILAGPVPPASIGDRGEQSVLLVGSLAEGTLGLLRYDQGEGVSRPGHMRILAAHGVDDLDSLDMILNEEKTVRAVRHLEGSRPVGVPSGKVRIRVEQVTGRIKLFTRAYDLDDQGDFSVILAGSREAGTLKMRLLEDEIGVFHPPIARLRLYHGAPGVGDLDLLVDGGLADTGVPYDRRRDYVPLRPGRRRVAVNLAGTDSQLLDLGTIELVSGGDVTAWVYVDGSGEVAGAFGDDPDVPGDASTARVRFLEVAPLAGEGGAVDVWLDDEILFEGVPLGEITDYAAVSPGSRHVRVDLAGGDPILGPTGVSLPSGADVTLSLHGLPEGDPPLELSVIADDRS